MTDGTQLCNHLTTVTMPRGGTTQTRTFSYNTLGQLVTTVNPENGSTTLAYNTDGSLFSKTDQKAQRIEYTYDLFRRVTEVRKYQSNGLEDACQRVNYYYDTNPFESWFTQNGWGRLAAVEYGGSSCTGGLYRESYSYTAGGLPVKKKLWVEHTGNGQGALVGEWSYDNEGKILTVKYPDTLDAYGNAVTGRTYTYGHDGMGRLATLVDNRPGDPPGWTWVSAASYNAAWQLTQLTGTNFTETREYNERLQVTRIYQPGSDTHYYYPDAQNNDGRITRRNINGTDKTYTYDTLGRLSTAGSASYTYDGFGNRLTQTTPSMNLTYNASNNRITTTGYSYDNNGNLTATPDLTMSYDVENRLAQAQTAAVTEMYVYAPNGQRVSKQKMGSYEWYFNGVDGRLIGTYTRCSMVEMLFQEQTTNVYFGGRTLQAQGESVMRQDRLGTVSWSATNYVPFGEDAKDNDGLGFTGYYRDGGRTGLDYAQQRYYAPSIGRFTTADPYMPSAAIARPQSWNRYVYVENDPVNKVDPSGLDPKDEAGCYYNYNTNTVTCTAPPVQPADLNWYSYNEFFVQMYAAQIMAETAPLFLARPIRAGRPFGASQLAGMRSRAISDAKAKLVEGSDCWDLFNTNGKGLAPTVLLEKLSQGNTDYGSIKYGKIEEGTVSATTQLYLPMPDSSLDVSVLITLNNNVLGSWFLGDDTHRAVAILHELGHAYDILWPGSSAIKNDGSATLTKDQQIALSTANSKLIGDTCFK